MKIGSIVIDCNEFDKVSAFWEAALRYAPRHPAKPDDFVLLGDPSGRGPNVGVNKKHKSIVGKIRVHLELYTDDQKGEVERLIGLGATVIRWPQPGEDFVILSDPEGNHFCVIDGGS